MHFQHFGTCTATYICCPEGVDCNMLQSSLPTQVQLGANPWDRATEGTEGCPVRIWLRKGIPNTCGVANTEQPCTKSTLSQTP
eukprot:1090477-Pelagomonas_calceolata.AAC.1